MMAGKFRRMTASMLGLPGWIQLWMIVLFGTNMASIAFLDSEVGGWIAFTFLIVASLNMPMMVIQGGLTRLLSLPHFAWLPLVVYLYANLFGATPLPSGSLRTYALMVFTMNTISLLFDVLEAFRWFNGRREVLGLDRLATPDASLKGNPRGSGG